MNQAYDPDKHFTVTEVRAMHEALRSEIRLVAEQVSCISSDVHILKQDVAVLKSNMVIIKDVLRITIPSHSSRLDRLEAKVFP